MNTVQAIYQNTRHAARDARGMTLIDMAIALMVIGILATPMIYSYNQWRRQQVMEQNDTRSILPSQVAINQFYLTNNRYPCPALRNLAPGDDGYGVENCTAQIAPNGTLGKNGNTLIGAVPFATLKIPESTPVDSYDNKLTYIVTKTQTVTPAPGTSPPDGVIKVLGYSLPCNTTAAPQQLANNAHFALIMHGERGIGAFDIHGRRTQECRDTGDASYTNEDINCDDDDTVLASTCSFSLGEGPSYYDDRVYTQDAFNSVMWNTMAENVNQGDILTRSSQVGINVDSPEKTLDVAGNTLISTDENSALGIDAGQIRSDDFCHWAAPVLYQSIVSRNNTPMYPARACFDPDMIAGADPMMDCAQSQYGPNSAYTGIVPNRANNVTTEYGMANCKLTFSRSANGQSRTCPGNQHMIGIDAAGNIQCAN